MKVHLAVATHIIILSRSPGKTDTGSEAAVSMAELAQDPRVKAGERRKSAQAHPRRHAGSVQHKPGAPRLRASVHRDADIQRQAVHNLPTVAKVQVQVLEVIQMYLIEIEEAVGHRLQLVQYPAAVNAVAVTELQVQRRTLAGPIAEIRPHAPIELLVLEIVTDAGNDAQKPIPLEEAAVLELLPIGEAAAAAVTQQERINQRRTTHTAQLIQIHRVTADQRIAQLPPELLPLTLHLLPPRKGIPMQEVVLIQRIFVRSQRDGTQRIEIGGIAPESIRIGTQRIGIGQIIFVFRQSLPYIVRPCLHNILVIEHRLIASLHHIAQKAEDGIHLIPLRQELVRAPHITHLQQIVKPHHLIAARETHLTHAPHIVADNQVTAHQLKALVLGNEAYLILKVMPLPHHRIKPIGIELLRVGRQRREQFVVQQRGGIDIDVEILGQPPVHLPKLGSGADTRLHLLVVDVGSREVQVAVSFHHIFPHPLAETEHGGDIAEKTVLLADVHPPLDVKFRLVALHNTFIERGEEDDLLHNGVCRNRILVFRIRDTARLRLPGERKQQANQQSYKQRTFQQ